MAQGVRVLDEARANTLLPTIADAIRTVGLVRVRARVGLDPLCWELTLTLTIDPDPDPDPDP